MIRILHVVSSLLLLALAGMPARGQSTTPAASDTVSPGEQSIRAIPLAGPLAHPHAEISGLAWWKDELIFLPQLPSRFGTQQQGRLFALPRAQIEAFLEGHRAGPLRPRPITFAAPGLKRQIDGFEGFEALAFKGNRAFLAIESSGDTAMRSYLVEGKMAADGQSLRLDARSLAAMPSQVRLDNITYESLLTDRRRLIVLHEANGANVNPRPAAYGFDLSLRRPHRMPFPHLEYRLTDVTELDAQDRFWGINFFFPGDRAKLNPAPDSLHAEYGAGTTHRRNETVERLVEFRLTDTGIIRTDAPPVQLRLLGNGQSRNWEGVVRFGERGFLLATDTYPETILAFVPLPSTLQ